jgi:hypothetical protein
MRSHGRSQRSPREVNLHIDRDVLAIAAVECVVVRRKRKREKEPAASSHGYHSTLHRNTGRPHPIGQWCHTGQLQVFVSYIYVNKVVLPVLSVLTMGSLHTKPLPYESSVSAHVRTCSVAGRGRGGYMGERWGALVGPLAVGPLCKKVSTIKNDIEASAMGVYLNGKILILFLRQGVSNIGG